MFPPLFNFQTSLFTLSLNHCVLDLHEKSFNHIILPILEISENQGLQCPTPPTSQTSATQASLELAMVYKAGNKA